MELPKVEIDLLGLRRNYRSIKALVGQVEVMGVVKSDAYGHGLLPVSRALEEEKIGWLGVFHWREALELRQGGIRARICVLGGIQGREEAKKVVELELNPILVDLESAQTMHEEARRWGKVVECFLKVDTGMGRLGMFPDEIYELMAAMRGFRNLRPLGLVSHLSSADEDDPSFTLEQIRLFRRAIKAGQEMGLGLPLNHIANTAGALRFKESHFQMVRVGIFLYGALPRHGLRSVLLPEPLMTLRGEVVQVRYLPPNMPVSYCRTYYTSCPTKVAVVSVGYADGIPRSLSNRGYCLIKGRRAPIIGDVCMNLTICNIEGIPDVERGDEVIFLGSQGQDEIRAEELASWAGTIPYEVFCSIGSRNQRVYK
jgi:alanine racemase